jgi:hypothetical protein
MEQSTSRALCECRHVQPVSVLRESRWRDGSAWGGAEHDAFRFPT